MSSLFSLPWSRHRWVNQPDTAPSSLRKLPSDLVNRRLSIVIGPTYWPRLRTGAVIPRHREQFLSTFARDLPSWFYCHLCSHLHALNRIRPPGPFDHPSHPLWCQKVFDGDNLLPYLDAPFPYYEITFHHLQLVMRRHYLGPGYGISTDDLSFVQLNELGKSERRKETTTLFSVEARVWTEPARLCLHIQRWTVLHTNALELAVERAKCVEVCFHHSAEDSETFHLIMSSLDEHLTAGPQEPKRRFCRRCKFIYQLEVLDTGSDGLAIVITKWLDLGSGLTPLDQRWRFRTEQTPEDDEADHAGDAERCRLEFEKGGGLKQHAITLRNASYLSKQQYRQTMNELSAGIWILQAGRRRVMYNWIAIWHLLLLGGWTLYCIKMAWPDPLQALIFRRM